MPRLIIEDGTGASTSANTYATPSYVATYCVNMGLTDWATGTTTNQINSIFRAMSYIEGQRFRGVKADYDYPLKWPRASAIDDDGYTIEDDEIPENLKRGLARASYEEYMIPGILQPNLEKSDFTTMERIDVISLSYQRGKEKTVFQIIDDYLRGLTIDSRHVLRT